MILTVMDALDTFLFALIIILIIIIIYQHRSFFTAEYKSLSTKHENYIPDDNYYSCPTGCFPYTGP